MKTKSIIASVLFTVLAGNTYAATNIPARGLTVNDVKNHAKTITFCF